MTYIDQMNMSAPGPPSWYLQKAPQSMDSPRDERHLFSMCFYLSQEKIFVIKYDLQNHIS